MTMAELEVMGPEAVAHELAEAQTRIAELEAAAAAMREALDGAQSTLWRISPNSDRVKIVSEFIDLAVATDAGRALEDRLKHAESEMAACHEILDKLRALVTEHDSEDPGWWIGAVEACTQAFGQRDAAQSALAEALDIVTDVVFDLREIAGAGWTREGCIARAREALPKLEALDKTVSGEAARARIHAAEAEAGNLRRERDAARADLMRIWREFSPPGQENTPDVTAMCVSAARLERAFTITEKERDAARAELAKEAELRAELTAEVVFLRGDRDHWRDHVGLRMSAEVDRLKAEVARLGAELRQARFVASGQAGDRPAEHVVRENHRLRVALREIVEMHDPKSTHYEAAAAFDRALHVAKVALRVVGRPQAAEPSPAATPEPPVPLGECAHLRRAVKSEGDTFNATCIDCGAPL